MKLLILLLAAAGLAAPAQNIRYQHGDDPQWADPKFDDASWPRASTSKLPLPASEGSHGMVWLRFRVPVPPDNSPLAIRLARENGACTPGEFWVNGVLVGSQGRFPPQPQTLKVCETNVFDLPNLAAPPGETVVVAWRGWEATGFASGTDYSPPVLFDVEIGPRDYVRSRENEVRARLQLAAMPDLVLYLLEFLAALGVLAIWWRNRTRILFWFAAFVLAWSAMGLLLLWVTNAPGASHLSYWSITWAGWLAFDMALIQFMQCASDPPRWTIHALRAVCAAWIATAFFPVLLVVESPKLLALSLNCSVTLGVALFLGQMALAAWFLVRGTPETRGLAFTLFLAGFAYLLVDNLGVFTAIRAGDLQISPDNLSTALLVGAMGYQLLSRLWRDWRKKEELDAEFEAAREMQESLVQRLPDTPGFAVETAYRPASQVGGDFYRIFTAGSGAILVVAGDVSGKGLKAAMTVSVLVGAMESIETREPGLFLTKLNRAAGAHLQSGFVTCCAALIRTDGEAVIANAGHLPPYLNGREAAVECGLPLGVADGVVYEESVVHAEQFTFVSDGVVESENARRELFGFDRTREISAKSAGEIAEAARAWGQNDDITVVTVRRSNA